MDWRQFSTCARIITGCHQNVIITFRVSTLQILATVDSERHIYQYFKDGRSPVRASVKDVGCEKGFYSLPRSDDEKILDHEVIEKPLAVFDEWGSKAINYLLSKRHLGNDGLEVFCQYISTLVVRTPACYSRAEQMLIPNGQEMVERIVKYDTEFRNNLEGGICGKRSDDTK
ncbi:MAG: DUF4238 domain-containing protein [Limisphaerales bacterium]